MKYLILISFLFSFYLSTAQYNRALFDSEAKLKIWFDSLFSRNETRYTLPDSKKIAFSDSIRHELVSVLNIEDAFSFPFDSLTKLGKLASSDSLLRVFSWNIRLKGGKYIFYGFVLYRNHLSSNIAKVIELTDKTDSLPDNEVENLTLSGKQWYGASYYQIIPVNEKKQKYYILIGWKGYNAYVNRKVVDVLFFNKKGKPLFGKNIFKSEQKTVKRLIFSHSLKASMSCRYDESLDAIIFDHLVPASNIYQGMYEFYGPNGTYDAYFKRKNMWMLKEDIEPKNPRKKNELPSKN
ncbi:MAG TPA: hypothetical protein PLP65_07635 [Bacteroidales bacterium]|nr:hypothetical protein [Bacteroidales bacterium]